MRLTLLCAYPLAATVALASGCAMTHVERNLIISEVGKKQVELYLDEPAGEILRLGQGMVLTVTTTAGNSSELDFGTYDHTMPGGTFLMIWEEGGYTGPPVRQDYPGGQTGYVPGLKVRQRFFDGIDSSPSELRLKGEHSRTTGVVVILPHRTVERVRDVVRFGAPAIDRPATGGSFRATGNLGFPSGSVSLQRRWTPAGPLDRDEEDDWKHNATSWGVPTP